MPKPVARFYTALEIATLQAWAAWGSGWHMFCRCDGCGEVLACRGKTRRKMLCIDCFDQRVEA